MPLGTIAAQHAIATATALAPTQPSGSTSGGAVMFLLIVLTIALSMCALWVFTIIDIARHSDAVWEQADKSKTTWLLLVVLIGVLASVLYLVMARPALQAAKGRVRSDRATAEALVREAGMYGIPNGLPGHPDPAFANHPYAQPYGQVPAPGQVVPQQPSQPSVSATTEAQAPGRPGFEIPEYPTPPTTAPPLSQESPQNEDASSWAPSIPAYDGPAIDPNTPPVQRAD